MSKLFVADLPRIFKSKLFYILAAIAIIFPAISAIANYTQLEEKEMVLTIASSELCVNMTSLLAVFAGLFSAILIGKEFSKGVIRNKILVTKKRSSILISWTIIYVITTMIYFVLLFGSLFLTLAIMGTSFKGFDGKALSMNLLIIFLYMIKFQLFSILAMCIFPDEKMAGALVVFNILTMIPLALLQNVKSLAKIMSYVSRISYIGFVNQDEFSMMVQPDKAWLTIAIIVVMSVGYMIAAIKIFNKKDIK